MSALSDLALTGVLSYGAPVFGLALLLGALGVPIPGTLLVVAAGAFSRQGVLDMGLAAGWGLLGAVAGDSLSYGLGRFAGVWMERRFGSSAAWHKAQQTFDRRGGWAIYLTRFLLTAAALPTNWIAGSSRYSYRRFLWVGAVGELTWLAVYGGLGYLFGSQWELVSDFLNNFGGFALGLVLLVVGGMYALRTFGPSARQMMRSRWKLSGHQHSLIKKDALQE